MLSSMATGFHQKTKSKSFRTEVIFEKNLHVKSASQLALSRPLIFTIYYTSFGTFFHKAIQELITISEGDMRKVRQEAWLQMIFFWN